MQMLNKPRNYKIISLLIKIFFYLAKQIILDDVFRPLQFGIFSISEVMLWRQGSKGWDTAEPLPQDKNTTGYLAEVSAVSSSLMEKQYLEELGTKM